jgi:hypothetical protein
MNAGNVLRPLGAVFALTVTACLAFGQWSSDPTTNLAIADRPGEQSVPLIHATSDGGCYVSWFDGSTGRYDVYLQRLDPAGNELWAHNGLLLADRSFEWTQYYGLDVDASDNALLAFRDDRFGGVLVTAVKVNPEGELLWGPNGIQLGGVGEPQSPKIAATTDGCVVVGWAVEHGDHSDIRFQRLDASGAAQWDSELVFAHASGSFGRITLHASDDGAVIAAWIKEGPGFWDPKHVYAQKISATGEGLWGATPLVVFDSGSLAFGDFPEFVPDGSGGAVFGWDRIDPTYDCYAQHVLADGTEQFGHNGALASTVSARIRVDPCVSFSPATNETFLFWVEIYREPNQPDEYGVYGQKFDHGGNREWSNQGAVVAPLTTNPVTLVRNLQYADGAMVFWGDTVRIGIEHLKAARVDGSGNFVWEPPTVTFASSDSHKDKLATVFGTPGEALLVWMDDRNDLSDIYGQNIFEDGSMGAGPASFQFVFLDPPTGPPPETLCGCEMTPFLEDPRPVYENVESVPSPCPSGADVLFSIPMNHRRVPESWMTWSHGYTGDVYFTNSSPEVTLTLPPGSCGFYFYVQPSEWLLAEFQVTVNGEFSCEPFSVEGQGGATYVGVCGTDLETIRIVNTDGIADGFAVGEFGICCACGPVYGACCDPETGICIDNVEANDCIPPLQFSFETLCENLDPPCGNPGACCDPYTGDCEDNVPEMSCPEGFRFEPGQACAELEPPCGTPGCCCVDATETVSVEFEAVCLALGGRFIPGVLGEDCVAEAFDPPCGEWECVGILYAPTQNDNRAWRMELSALAGCPVDYWDARAGTPTLEYLRNYCCVFTWVDYPYADNAAMGDVLANYVDAGGKVILGQWAYRTFQGNFLAGRIMTPAYCPVTGDTYESGTYSGDGTDCVWCNVTMLDSPYVDRCTLVDGAESDGTLTDGYLAAAWRADRRVYYSPGNTGPNYMPGDTAQLTANMYACDSPLAYGACCDPYSGTCVDGVECADCPPESQFFINKTCEELDPPCGNPGCCCDDDTGMTTAELEANCAGRFVPGVPEEECDPAVFEPPCGEYESCPHSIVMWDDYGDGWNDGFIDVYVDDELVLAGVTLPSGYGPETVYFEAATGQEISTVWTPGGWQLEVSYCIYDGLDIELGCDGLDGGEPLGISVTAACEEAVCGDGICAEVEDCCTCPEDCGEYDCLTQLPDQYNGVFSDLDCGSCEEGMQVAAENFAICDGDQVEIDALRFWGGYLPNNTPADPDAFTVVFRDDAGPEGPGAVITTFGPMPATTRAATGVMLFGANEYEYTIDLNPNVPLEGGTYWVEIYNNTTDSPDSWFWETGDADDCAGVFNAALSFELPEVWILLHPPGDLALDIQCAQCFGDLDGDGDVDLSDLAILLSNYGMTSGAQYEDGDLDGDGDVDLTDLAALLAVYGETCP